MEGAIVLKIVMVELGRREEREKGMEGNAGQLVGKMGERKRKERGCLLLRDEKLVS